jgi:SAM-dependent methyltransferase
MRDFDLGERFDAVLCLFSSIGYVRGVRELRRAIATMARHVAPGGVLVVEPWISPDEHAAHGEPWVELFEQPGVKVAVMETSTLEGRLWIEDAHYLVWTSEGIEHLQEREATGAFRHEHHLAAFRDAGLAVDHDPVGLTGRGLYLSVRR